MELMPSSACAPSAPAHLVKRIKSIDPELHVRFYSHMINPITLRPLVKETGELIPSNRWHLFSRCGNGKYYLIFIHEDEKGEFLPFDERLVRRIENDALRILGLKEMLIARDRAIEEKERLGKEKMQALREDFARANQSKIQDVLADPYGSRIKEKETITSFSGQTKRSRITTEVTDDRDYEVPDWSQVTK